jgi:hypothetical protein
VIIDKFFIYLYNFSKELADCWDGCGNHEYDKLPICNSIETEIL